MGKIEQELYKLEHCVDAVMAGSIAHHLELIELELRAEYEVYKDMMEFALARMDVCKQTADKAHQAMRQANKRRAQLKKLKSNLTAKDRMDLDDDVEEVEEEQ